MREELRRNYEEGAWLSATRMIDSFLQIGDVGRAIEFAKKAIKDWEEEDKFEIIEKFKEWLKERNIDIG